MATTLSAPRTTTLPIHWSLADIQRHLGGVPLERIRSFPPPGLATVEDADRIQANDNQLCELIDGILVEKAMGWFESVIAGWIMRALNNYLIDNPIGKALGEAGTLQLLPDHVRIPDVCFISWSRFPADGLPREPIPLLVPDLAIEVLSQSNTPAEMAQKLADYFRAGVSLVWYINPATRLATVYSAPDDPGTVHAANEPLSGGDVLPGFSLVMEAIYREADRESGPTASA